MPVPHPQIDLLEPRRLLATFTVTTAADAGPGSLRDAIDQANALAGADVVQFNIPGTGPHTIALNSLLPAITQPLTISGQTQPGFAGTPQIAVDGSAIAPGSRVGISIASASVEVRSLALVGFETGVRIAGNNARVLANHIGVGPAGTARGEMDVGVLHVSGSTATIGQAGAGNVIGFGAPGDPGIGISLNGGLSHQVNANRIGTTATGNTANGSIGTGILVGNNTGATIGTIGAGNVVAGINGVGIDLTDGGADLSANRVGIALNNAALGNSDHGIHIGDGTYTIDNNNIIAHNGGAGIRITGLLARASVTGNPIFNNAGLGIDLGAPGPDANDPLDADAGPNGLQNYPTQLSARRLPDGKVRFRGTLHSTPLTGYFVDFYRSTTRDPSGFGEGQTWIGFDSPTTDIAGNASWDFVSNSVYPANIWITNTAEGALNTGVSEFSRAYKVYIPGDLNGDGVVNNLDIAPFVQALTSPAAFAASYPDTPIEAGDINDDGATNNLDIAPFVALLTSTRPAAFRPEASPTSFNPTPRSSAGPSSVPVRGVVRTLFADDDRASGTTPRAPVRGELRI